MPRKCRRTSRWNSGSGSRLLKKYSSLEKRHFELEDLLDQGWTPRMVSAPAVPEELPQDKQPQIQGKMPAIETDISPSKTPAEHSSIDTNSPVVAAISTAAEVLDLKLSMKDHWEKQNLTNTKIALSAHRRMKEMVGVLTGLNFDISKLKLTTLANRGNIGGPLVKLTSSNPEKFSGNDFASLALFEKIYLMETALLELPIHRPLSTLRTITSAYGPRLDPFQNLYAMHHGIDIGAPTGDPIFATAAGTVIKTKSRIKSGYGKLIVIQHSHGLTTHYGHLSKIQVQTGDRIKPGDVIGLVGNTGRSTGPHLHYEIRLNNSHVNPVDYLEAAKYVF